MAISIILEQSRAMRTTQEDNMEYDDDLDAPTESMLPVVLAPHTPAPSPAEPAEPIQQGESKVLITPAQPHYSPVPIIVGVCFLIVQVLLLVRVILLLFSIGNTSLWGRVLLTASGVFAFPVRLLLDRIVAQAGPDVINYLAPLLAVLLYGIVARILVRFLKAFLNSR